MPKHSPRLFGFTLLELLVVISIIGILVAMGAASFSVAQKQGRDARRKSDIKSIQNAMEQYYAINNDYSTSGCASGVTITILPGVTGDATTVVSTVKSTESYTCTTPTASTYCVCADIDGTNGNATDSSCGGFGATTGGYYCARQLQ